MRYADRTMLRCSIFVAFLSSANVSLVLAFPVSVTYEDPAQQFVAFYDSLTSNLVAAAAAWGEHLSVHPNATLDVELTFMDIPTASASPGDYTYLGIIDDRNVWEPAFVNELTTGVDREPSEPDAEINIGFDYFNEMYLDPDPFARSEPVPEDQVDAVSTLIHELGHVLGIFGWRDWSTGEFSGPDASVFDTLVQSRRNLFYFRGAAATAEYGGPVPLTRDNLYHLGNDLPPGDDLLDDVMNGVVNYYGTRDYVSDLDVAILSDLGVRLEPERTLVCDFVEDTSCTIADINALVSAIANTSSEAKFDVNGDGAVDLADLGAWRVSAGAENLPDGAPYPAGDTNLDGQVSQFDLLIWDIFKFESTGDWSRGDFNADGVTDVSDFNIWNRSHAATLESAVPEPATAFLALFAALCASGFASKRQ